MAKLISETTRRQYRLNKDITFITEQTDGSIEVLSSAMINNVFSNEEKREKANIMIKEAVEEINLTNKENKFIY